MLLLACLCVILQLVSPQVDVSDRCIQNVCAFDNPKLPKDISCVNHTDCYKWSHPCQNNGCRVEGTLQCVYSGLGDYECVCRDGYDGRACTAKESEGEGESEGRDNAGCDFCYNDGTCVHTDSSYSCTCPSEWVGMHCQQRKVPPNPKAVCELPPLNLDPLVNTSLWYEVARSEMPSGHIDACTTFNFVRRQNEVVVNVSSIAMNRITDKREGVVSEDFVLNISVGGVTASDQPFLSSPKERETPMKASLYEIKHKGVKYLVLHLCETSHMFGKQEVVSVMSEIYEDKEVGDIVRYANGMLPLNVEPRIQGHDFCDTKNSRYKTLRTQEN